jgi:fructoselysine and glucoselysine-specific PTS system IIC component
MIFTKSLMPFFFLGFLLTAYANIPVLGVALIAVIIGIEKVGIFDQRKPVLAAEGDDDDDF